MWKPTPSRRLASLSEEKDCIQRHRGRWSRKGRGHQREAEPPKKEATLRTAGSRDLN